MLQSFGMAWENAGVAHSEVLGRWPAIAAHVVPADVAVCHHVVYNVADIESFLRELSAHTRRGVMVELPS